MEQLKYRWNSISRVLLVVKSDKVNLNSDEPVKIKLYRVYPACDIDNS